MGKLNYATTDALASIFGSIVMWVILIIIGFLTTLYGAFVLREMWQWFALPAGFEMISQRTSIGIFLIIGLITAKLDMSSKPEDANKSASHKGIVALLGYLIYFTIAWGSAAIWHFWLL